MQKKFEDKAKKCLESMSGIYVRGTPSTLDMKLYKAAMSQPHLPFSTVCQLEVQKSTYQKVMEKNLEQQYEFLSGEIEAEKESHQSRICQMKSKVAQTTEECAGKSLNPSEQQILVEQQYEFLSPEIEAEKNFAQNWKDFAEFCWKIPKS